MIIFGDLKLDLDEKRAYRDNCDLDLTLNELRLLKTLMDKPNVVLSYKELATTVYGSDFKGNVRVIDLWIRYLRTRTENESKPRLIHTVRGVGYVLREEE